MIEAALREQLRVAALLDDAPLVHDDDGVGAADRRQTVRDDEARATVPQPRHRLLDEDLGARVDVARRLVEDEHAAIRQEGARDREELLLPARDVRRVLGEDGVVAIGQRPDELIGVRCSCRRDDLLHRGVLLAIRDVVADRPGEEPRVLQDHPESAPHDVTRQLPRVDAVEPDGTAVDLVEPHEEIDDRRLARARRSDDRDRLPRSHVEREVFDQRLVGQIAE